MLSHHTFNSSVTCGISGINRLSSCLLRSFLSSNYLCDNSYELADLLLRYFSFLLGTGMFTVHRSNHALQLLLKKLCLDMSHSFSFLLHAQSDAHCLVLLVDDGKALLQIVLILLDLTQVDVYNLHGVLAGRRECHDVIPMLKDELVVMHTYLFLFDCHV